MTRQQIVILVILGTLTLLVLGIGGVWLAQMLRPAPSESAAEQVTPAALSPVSTTPSSAPLPPTPTATSTPVLATATLVLAPDPVLVRIFTALDKTDSANTFRLQVDASASGILASGANGQNAIPLLNMTGENAGADSHLIMKGLSMTRLTSDPTKPLEITYVGGKSYVKGPLPLLGAKDNKWYVLPSNQGSMQASPSSLYLLFYNSQPAIAKSGTEKLDGRTCDVYTGDKYAALDAFANLGGMSQLSASAREHLQDSIKNAEFKLWICDDGYAHQMRIGFDASDASQPNRPISFKVLLHIYDFGTKISIAAPPNAPPATPLVNLIPPPTATPLRIPTLGLPAFTPFATFVVPTFAPFPTFSLPFLPRVATPPSK